MSRNTYRIPPQFIYDKVRHLSSDGLNVNDISEKLQITLNTVERILGDNE